MADIVGTAVKAGSFNTLVAAVKATGLVEALKGTVPFTVFAPNDEAFAKLPAGKVDGLLKDLPKLKKILTYHVVASKVMVADIVKLKSAKTVAGSEVKTDASKGVKVNSSTVTTPDVAADNGAIHIVDTVLLPAQTVSD
ncbi:MAG: fasciclin domain-containing protein [Phormidesmis sp. CAN_BIN36]|nr:fasciclin domain-containing protein [Phormidesmis sp. CAN_BIN36]